MLRQTPTKTSARRVLLLQGVFIVGFLLVFGLEQVFSSLINELDQVSQNERARLFIGEQILRDIEAAEMNVYRMTLATGNNAHLNYENNIREYVEHLHRSLAVLRHGGQVSRTIYLNLDEADQMVKTVSYTPDNTKSYEMEQIELEPLVDQILEKTPPLRIMLEAREIQRQQENGGNITYYEKQIKSYVKQIPSLFIRLKENANRLSYDTQQRLTEIEKDLKAQKERYEATKIGLIILVILSVVGVGIVFARQINQNNRQLTETWQEMLRAKETADLASKAKSDFVSRMSHELRTPLNAILGFAQLLEMDDLPNHQKTPVQHICRAGKHLLELINQVLDISKIEAGKLETEMLPIDLPQLLTDTAAISQERITNKGLTFNINLNDAIPHFVISDPTRLRQVLINLIGNAIKFTDSGNITLNAMPLENAVIRFEVIDTGIGMTDQAQSRLFKPFSQADESITRRYGGTGLGLMLCKEIVEALGGNIGVISEVNKGSCFWFELPLTPTETITSTNSFITMSEPITSTAPPKDLSLLFVDKRLLLVEDNPVNQMVASRLLQKLGVTPDIANNGQEAIDLLKHESYDLVLLDLEMPVMDGYTTIAHIRTEESYCDEYRHQLIIVMSANALNEDRQRVLALGVDDYITKPISFSALQATLEKWLA